MPFNLRPRPHYTMTTLTSAANTYADLYAWNTTTASTMVNYYTPTYTITNTSTITYSGGGGGSGAYQFRPLTSDAQWYAWTQNVEPTRLSVEARANVEATRERRHLIRARARSLLDSCLDDTEQARLVTTGCIHVIGSAGHHFCIKAEGQAGNVHWFDPRHAQGCRRPLGTFCAHPSGLPDADAWLTQKLAIETDEALFLRIANVQAGSRPPAPVAA